MIENVDVVSHDGYVILADDSILRTVRTICLGSFIEVVS